MKLTLEKLNQELEYFKGYITEVVNKNENLLYSTRRKTAENYKDLWELYNYINIESVIKRSAFKELKVMLSVNLLNLNKDI